MHLRNFFFLQQSRSCFMAVGVGSGLFAVVLYNTYITQNTIPLYPMEGTSEAHINGPCMLLYISSFFFFSLKQPEQTNTKTKISRAARVAEIAPRRFGGRSARARFQKSYR